MPSFAAVTHPTRPGLSGLDAKPTDVGLRERGRSALASSPIGRAKLGTRGVPRDEPSGFVKLERGLRPGLRGVSFRQALGVKLHRGERPGLFDRALFCDDRALLGVRALFGVRALRAVLIGVCRPGEPVRAVIAGEPGRTRSGEFGGERSGLTPPMRPESGLNMTRARREPSLRSFVSSTPTIAPGPISPT